MTRGHKKTDGSRTGPGRPPKSRHREDFAPCGAPPEDLLALADWAQDLVARAALQAHRGRGSREVREEIRAGAIAIAALLPHAITADAQGLVRAEGIDIDAEPPTDPLLRIVWMVRLLAVDLWRAVSGQSNSRVGKELRASARAMGKILPPDALVEARRKLRDRARRIGTSSRRRPADPQPAAVIPLHKA